MQALGVGLLFQPFSLLFLVVFAVWLGLAVADDRDGTTFLPPTTSWSMKAQWLIALVVVVVGECITLRGEIRVG